MLDSQASGADGDTEGARATEAAGAQRALDFNEVYVGGAVKGIDEASRAYIVTSPV